MLKNKRHHILGDFRIETDCTIPEQGTRFNYSKQVKKCSPHLQNLHLRLVFSFGNKNIMSVEAALIAQFCVSSKTALQNASKQASFF